MCLERRVDIGCAADASEESRAAIVRQSLRYFQRRADSGAPPAVTTLPPSKIAKERIMQRNFVAVMLIAGAAVISSVHVQQAHAREPGESYRDLSREARICRQRGGEIFERVELFFGLSKSNAGVVSEQEFADFVDRDVTTRFPDGLTLLSAKGQFKNAAGNIIKEDSKQLILLFPASKAASAAADAIRDAYKAAFQQESVLRVDARSCVSF
jgi:hypothetical protein